MSDSDIYARLRAARSELAEVQRQATRLDAMRTQRRADAEKARAMAAYNPAAAQRVAAFDEILARREVLAPEIALREARPAPSLRPTASRHFSCMRRILHERLYASVSGIGGAEGTSQRYASRICKDAAARI
jgi:hypothetical protein